MGGGTTSAGPSGQSHGQGGRAVALAPKIDPDVSMGRPLDDTNEDGQKKRKADPYDVSTDSASKMADTAATPEFGPNKPSPNSPAALEADQRAAEKRRQERNLVFMTEVLRRQRALTVAVAIASRTDEVKQPVATPHEVT